MSKVRVFPVSFASYVDGPRIGALYAYGVAQALLHKLPEDASVEEKKAMKVVVALAEAVVSVINEREKNGLGKIRPLMLAFANIFSAVFGIVGGFARLGGTVGADAQRILDAAFVDGVSFVKLDALAAWAEGKRRLGRLDDEELAGKLEAIIGVEQLAQLRAATKSLGDALSTASEHEDAPSRTALAEALTAFCRAVASYARIASARVDETDRASVDRFLKQMGPLDEYRESRKGATDDEEDELVVDEAPTDPIVPLPSPAAPSNGV